MKKRKKEKYASLHLLSDMNNSKYDEYAGVVNCFCRIIKINKEYVILQIYYKFVRYVL